MQVLGIETSCDETATAVYDSEVGILSHCLYSQIDLHNKYGGVVPELASREHVLKVLPLIKKTLVEGKTEFNLLNAIAYTMGPGLVGSLLVGCTVGRSLPYALSLPSIGVHHMEAHLLASMLEKNTPEYPFLALLVSGGHTQIVNVKATGIFKILGESVDDAAGEAFDKTAKVLGLPYPGGPALSALAEKGVGDRFQFPRPMTNQPNLNFSFSGLKTSILYTIQAGIKENPNFIAENRQDLCACIQHSIVIILIDKLEKAIEKTGINQIAIAGGVSVNSYLRKQIEILAAKENFDLYIPKSFLIFLIPTLVKEIIPSALL